MLYSLRSPCTSSAFLYANRMNLTISLYNLIRLLQLDVADGGGRHLGSAEVLHQKKVLMEVDRLRHADAGLLQAAEVLELLHGPGVDEPCAWSR